MASPWLQLFRALIPSWRFFDRPASAPVMDIRYAKRDKDFGPWLRRLPTVPGPRGFKRLLLNGEENHLLACQSLLQQLQHDFDHGVTDGVSANLVENLAFGTFPGDPLAIEFVTAAKIQYRVTFPNGKVFLSPEHEQPAAAKRPPP